MNSSGHPVVDAKTLIVQSRSMEWLEIKVWLEQTTGLDRDALHIYAAVIIQLLFSLFFKRRIASVAPWILALVAVLANEYVDMQNVGDSSEQIAIYRDAAYHDIWNTMLLPTIFLLIARFWPSWLIGRSYLDNRPGAEPASD